MRVDYSQVLGTNGKFGSVLGPRALLNEQCQRIAALAAPAELGQAGLPGRPGRINRGRWFDLAGFGVTRPHTELKPAGQRMRHGHATSHHTSTECGWVLA